MNNKIKLNYVINEKAWTRGTVGPRNIADNKMFFLTQFYPPDENINIWWFL